jgi:hypothetical protein
MALGPVARKVEGWKLPRCPSILACFANDDGISFEKQHTSNDEVVITCQMLATIMHVMNVRYLRLFNDQDFISKRDPALHAVFPLL